MYDKRTNETRKNLAELKKIFEGQNILSKPIFRRIKIAEATKMEDYL